MSNLKMPEPVAWQNKINHCTQCNAEHINPADYDKPQWTKLYTAEALRDVLEQAAQLFPQPHMEYFGQNIQDAIRALIKEVK